MRCSLILVMLFTLSSIKAQTINTVISAKPAYTRLLNDENAYAYYHKDWRRLEDKLINHQKRTGNQLVFLMTPSLNGMNIEEVAVQIFRSWGIGDKETNTGLLVLIARKEKKIKIETGYGLEGQLTDLASGSIIREILEPGLSKFSFQLPPARNDKGYLPALEKAIDTLILLTGEINTKAIHNSAVQNNNSITKKRTSLAIYIMAAIVFFTLVKIGWRFLNNNLSSNK